ncbi:glycosyltransferase family 2 protein [Parathermosynechococcus lividus]
MSLVSNELHCDPNAALPSFSIILETENLAAASLEGLCHSLRSLVQQDLPLDHANEVLLIDSGDAPQDLLRQLCQRYPWLKVYPAAADIGYYQAKMLGAQVATGEIVVYCDSDCWYEPTWLRIMVATFTQGEHIQVVAGETTTRGAGFYHTAMALTYIFPQYSGDSAVQPTSHYFLNNVAFRRAFLLAHPIPASLPLYRGNCVIHAHNLQQNGYLIWRQPKARASHAPPSSVSHFCWRFLLIGHDYYWLRRLLATSTPQHRQSFSGLQGKLKVFYERLRRMVHNNPRHLLYLPFCLPVAAISVLLIFTGHQLTAFNPNYLLKTYVAKEKRLTTAACYQSDADNLQN